MSGVRVLVLGVGLALRGSSSRIGISGISSCGVTPIVLASELVSAGRLYLRCVSRLRPDS